MILVPFGCMAKFIYNAQFLVNHIPEIAVPIFGIPFVLVYDICL